MRRSGKQIPGREITDLWVHGSSKEQKETFLKPTAPSCIEMQLERCQDQAT